MSKVVLAEKPSVARDIARVLGATTKGEGFLSGGGYTVTWALGHLVSLCEPDELDPAYKKWRMEQLPILPKEMRTKVLPKTKKQYEIVKKLLCAKDTEEVVCATDSGREGELIFRYIYAQSGCDRPVKRLWISSMTDQAIREGFAALKSDREYDALYASAKCRSEADWLVGMNASRAFTLQYDALLSIGRVQTPTLALIVARDKEIAEFVPKDYYEIRADFGDYTGLWLDPETKKTQCPDRERAEAVCAAVQKQTGTVTEVTGENKRLPSPFLYDLTSLQRDANKKYGFPASKTLELTQSLYEVHKLVTYPRTDSRYLTHDMIPKIQKILRTLPMPYAPYAQPFAESPSTSSRIYNDEKVSDHHAIVPTGNYGALGRINEDERKIFNLVVKRLLSVHYPDYEYLSRQVLTGVAGETFKSTGRTVLQEGWKALYKDDKEEKSDDQVLPDLKVGDTRAVKEVKRKACKTKPPAPHNDASLLGMMEHAGRTIEDEALREAMKDSGLGTPATRAAVIERLIEVKYVVRKGKTLVSTEKGRRIISVVPEEIRSAETTGKWERYLAAMARDTDDTSRSGREARFLDSIRRFSAYLVDAAKHASKDVQFEREESRGGKTFASLGKCPLCADGAIHAGEKGFFCGNWKRGCKFRLWKDALKAQGVEEIGNAAVKKLLKGEGIPVQAGSAFLRREGGLEIRAVREDGSVTPSREA